MEANSAQLLLFIPHSDGLVTFFVPFILDVITQWKDHHKKGVAEVQT